MDTEQTEAATLKVKAEDHDKQTVQHFNLNTLSHLCPHTLKHKPHTVTNAL